jgi:hypothetical protein
MIVATVALNVGSDLQMIMQMCKGAEMRPIPNTPLYEGYEPVLSRLIGPEEIRGAFRLQSAGPTAWKLEEGLTDPIGYLCSMMRELGMDEFRSQVKGHLENIFALWSPPAELTLGNRDGREIVLCEWEDVEVG